MLMTYNKLSMVDIVRNRLVRICHKSYDYITTTYCLKGPVGLQINSSYIFMIVELKTKIAKCLRL